MYKRYPGNCDFSRAFSWSGITVTSCFLSHQLAKACVHADVCICTDAHSLPGLINPSGGFELKHSEGKEA